MAWYRFREATARGKNIRKRYKNIGSLTTWNDNSRIRCFERRPVGKLIYLAGIAGRMRSSLLERWYEHIHTYNMKIHYMKVWKKSLESLEREFGKSGKRVWV